MEKPQISVIVPVYKVEKYLDRCVRSIVEQTYQNLEIILVDDGSPDRCPQMCDEWARKDTRIRVIHKKNGGLSDARNAGMAEATGELLAFVDSDDWIEPNMYELLYQDMQKNRSDISACGVEMFWEDDSESPKLLTARGAYILDHNQAMTAIIQESLLKQPVWYKLYKTELVRELQFPVGKYHEDAFWSFLAIAKAKRVSVFDTVGLHYTQRSGSIMGERFSLRRLDGLEAKKLQLAFMRAHERSCVDLSHKVLLFTCMYAMQMTLQYLDGVDRATAIKRIKAVFREESRTLPSKLSTSERVWVLMSKLSLCGACRLRNLLGVGL